MTIIGVIPARFASTRFPGKVLADIHGKPMIQHVYERAKRSRRLQRVIIACDDKRIMRAAKKFHAQAVLTSRHHLSGTDRIIEAVRGIKAEIVLNIQGDEPLIAPALIDELAESLVKDTSAVMTTAVRRITSAQDVSDSNIVKVVRDRSGMALYFSRSPIPMNRQGEDFSRLKYYKHLGIYAYRRDFLARFPRLPRSRLESTEKLEQLRVLEAGYKIKTIITRYDALGVDTPEDLRRVRRFLAR